MSLLQIYQWVCQWKNFENRLTFGEVMGKSLVSCFFWDTVYIHLWDWLENEGKLSDTDCAVLASFFYSVGLLGCSGLISYGSKPFFITFHWFAPRFLTQAGSFRNTPTKTCDWTTLMSVWMLECTINVRLVTHALVKTTGWAKKTGPQTHDHNSVKS